MARTPRESTSESDFTDSEPDDVDKQDQQNNAQTSASIDQTSASPDDDRFPSHLPTDTSIAKDVFVNRGQFGRFASQWFSKQGWAGGKSTAPEASNSKLSNQAAGPDLERTAEDTAKANVGETAADQEPAVSPDLSQTPISSMAPKIVRIARLILESRCFFFSYDLDLTRNLSSTNGLPQAPVFAKLDPLVRLQFRQVMD